MFSTLRIHLHRPLTKYWQATGGTLIVIAAVAIGARLYLRLKIQKRRLLSSDILMSLAWVASVVTESFIIKLAQSNALDPKVKSTFEGFEGSSEELAFVLKVGTMANFVGCSDWKLKPVFFRCSGFAASHSLRLFTSARVRYLPSICKFSPSRCGNGGLSSGELWASSSSRTSPVS